MENNSTKIIYVVLALLLLGQGVIFYKIFYAGGQSLVSQSINSKTNATLHGDTASSTAPDLTDVVVGAAGPVTNSVSGTVTQLTPVAISVKDSTGSVQTIAITGDTKVQIGGKMKDAITEQKELAAYNDQVSLLMKDPIKNKEALAAMHLPATREFTPATLASITVGDTVGVLLGNPDSKGTNTATRIVKSDASMVAPQ